ncbi:MAG: hypothetical protein IKF96_06745, partial [Eggerthellaceae bacterium]|nr:hypothetical protein [Eggerthellaceae bacterium]
ALADAEGAAEECVVEPAASPEAAAQVGILFEDEALVVADKPAGMVMYPGPSHAGDTLANVLLARARATGHEGLIHPVHRLDAGTSGAVVFAYTGHAQHRLSLALHTEGFLREYVAFCEGVPCARDADGMQIGSLTCENGAFGSATYTIEAPIARKGFAPSIFAAVPEDDPDGKAARTHFAVEATATIATPEGPRTVSRLRLRLDTGRTHQIRIHLALTGHPLLGDDTYGAGPFAYLSATGEARVLTRPALHSARIAFAHPITGEALEITSPLPEDLAALFPGC